MKTEKSFITQNKKVLFLAVLAVVFLGSLIFSSQAEAFLFWSKKETVNIYPSKIDGNWKKTKNVLGKANISEDGKADKFSQYNSAIYEDGSRSLVAKEFSLIDDEAPVKTEEEEIIEETQTWLEENDPSFKIEDNTAQEIDQVAGEETEQEAIPKETDSSEDIPVENGQETIPEETNLENGNPDNNPESISFWGKISRFWGRKIAQAKEKMNFEELSQKKFNSANLKLSLAVLDKRNGEIIAEIENEKGKEEISPVAKMDDVDMDSMAIIYYSLDGENWTKLSSISYATISNSKNGGYFSYPLNFAKNWEDLKNLQVRVEGVVGGEIERSIYLDSLWVESLYDEGEEKIKSEDLELTGEKEGWKRSENPKFNIKNKESFLSQAQDWLIFWKDDTAVIVHLLSADGAEIELEKDKEYTLKDNSEIEFNFASSKKIHPGKYTLVVDFEQDGNSTTLVQDFTWGVLAINPNKSIYAPDETAKLAMAVLDENGNMVCNAKLNLTIKNEKLGIDEMLSTENGKIKINPECNSKTFTLIPDYEADFQLSGNGTYEMNLEAETAKGTYSITDKLEVDESAPFDVERITATRIYPSSNYPVMFNITARENFEGEIFETVPSSFEIYGLDKEGYQNHESEESSEKTKTIKWNVNIKKGDAIKIGYQYKAPDTSPESYLLGPLKFIKETGMISRLFDADGIFFQESRQWQIASDAVISQYSGGLLVYADGTAGTPKYQTFDDTNGFGSEQSASSVGAAAIGWLRVAASPTNDKWIIVTKDTAATNNVLKAQVCTGVDGGVSCGTPTTISSAQGTATFRNFDIAYEQTSGDALLVYGTSTADVLRKIEWTGGSWTNDAAIPLNRTSGTIEWVELTDRKGSDQIGIAYADTNDDISAHRWSGTAAGDEATTAITTLGVASNVRKFDITFEHNSGDMFVAATYTTTGAVAYGQLSGTTWTITTATTPDMVTSFVDLPEQAWTSPGADTLAIGTHGTAPSSSNATEGYAWTGSGISDGTAGDDTAAAWGSYYQQSAVSFFNSTYYGVCVISNSTAADDIDWWTMASDGSITDATTINTRTRGAARFLDLFDYPDADKVMLITADANSDLWADTWSGGTGASAWTDLTSGGAREIALASATTDVVDFAFRLSNNPPVFNIDNPATDTDVEEGSTYNIQYDLSDADAGDTATVDFYFETDGNGSGGTAISTCQDQAEGTNATCNFNPVTAGMNLSTYYYIYGIASDGKATNAAIVSTGRIRVTIPQITVSGGCFTNAGEGTPCTDDGTNEIKVAVNGVVDSGVDTTVDGSWSFSINKPASSATMVFFVNGQTAPQRATTVTKYDGSGNVDLVKMYQSQLVIGTDTGSANSAQTIAIADLDTTTNGYEYSDDPDVIFDVTAGADLDLNPTTSNLKSLYIIGSNIYQPASGGGGDTTAQDLYIEGTLIANSNALNVAGNWNNAGTFTAGSSTVTFNGASEQTLSGTMAGSAPFYNLTVGNGSTASTVTVASANVEISNVLTVSASATLNAGSGIWTLTGGGTPFVRTGTFNYQSSTFKFNSTADANITATDYYKLEFVGGSGTSEYIFACEDEITFNYKGTQVTYDTVTVGSQCWMDRNLGASQVATGPTDSASYGDYFQWGRLDDGHQTVGGGTSPTLSSATIPGHDDFILAPSSPYNWLNTGNSALWDSSAAYVNNPCPAGWHVPTGGTTSEWATALTTLGLPGSCATGSQCLVAAANSALKLPATGDRGNTAGSCLYQGVRGYYWSSSPYSTNSYYLYLTTTSVNPATTTFNRGYGFSVRCMQNP